MSTNTNKVIMSANAATVSRIIKAAGAAKASKYGTGGFMVWAAITSVVVTTSKPEDADRIVGALERKGYVVEAAPDHGNGRNPRWSVWATKEGTK